MMQPLGANGYTNGAGLGVLPDLAAPSLVTAAKIEERVKKMKDRSTDLRGRMEKDYARYRLEWRDSRWDTGKEPVGTSKYTSNEPWTFANRIMAILSSAKMIARVPYRANTQEQRGYGEAKEQFFIGALRMADRVLAARLMPMLQQALAFQVTLRGWYAGRAMLIKHIDSSTGVDISPFDPLHTYYGLNDDGLSWMAYSTFHTREDLEQRGISFEPMAARSTHSNEGKTIEVVHYHDGEIFCAVADGRWVKPPLPHNAGHVPCFLGAVGPMPFVTRDGDQGDVMGHGESVYAGLREVYDALNKTLSDRMTLVRRSLRPGYVLNSVGARKTLDGEPYGEGAEVNLDINEKLQPLELMSMAKDTDPMVAEILGEMQRASLPHTIYGQLAHPLSGYAINTLSQGLDLVVQDRVRAMERAYGQIAYLLCDQYKTGHYAPMTAQGYRTDSKAWFKAEIDPMAVAMSDDIEIEFAPKLPRDDQGAFQLAEIAKRSQILSTRTIQDEILKLQNGDAEKDLLREEQAEQMSPIAMLMGLIETSVRRGRPELAQVYTQDLQAMLMQRAMMMGGGAPGGPGLPGGPQMPQRGGAPPANSNLPPGPGGPNGGPPTPSADVRGPQMGGM